MYHIEFKGLDFAFELSPIAFEIFGKPVFWYGIIITLGIILSVAYAFYRLKKAGVSLDDMYDYAIFTIIFGIIGARTYYVLTNLETYTSFRSVIAIWEGGLGIYGGIIGGALALITVALIKKKSPLVILDCVGPAVMIGQIIGRWGNFTNQEAFGINTQLPWGMRSWAVGESEYKFRGTFEYLTINESALEEQYSAIGLDIDPSGYVHPTFLYESLWNLIGFIIIHFLYKKKKFNGQMVLLYFTWYGFGRMLIEGLRTDSLLIPGTQIRISQLVGFICFAVGTVLLTVFLIKRRKDPYLPDTVITEAEEELPEESDEDISNLMMLDGAESADLENNDPDQITESEENADGEEPGEEILNSENTEE